MDCPYGFNFGEDFDEDNKCDVCAEEHEMVYEACGDEWAGEDG